MDDAAVQPEPFDALRAVLGRLRPNDGPLRDLVITKLRKDAVLLQRIVDSDLPSSEGSENTIRAFLSTKTWPEEDHGWVDEALRLARYANWYSTADRPSYATKADGKDRPNERITMKVLCASVLLASCARHAPFSNLNEYAEPDAWTCLDIVDAVCRLGGPWPGAAVPFLADHALYALQHDDARDDPLLEGTRDIAAPLAILVAWRSVHEKARLPVRELFEAINAMTRHHRAGRDAWSLPTPGGRPEALRVITQTILDPVFGRLAPESREAARSFRTRFVG